MMIYSVKLCFTTSAKAYNYTESPRKGTSSFIYVFLTFCDSAVYNMDSKQVIMINRNLPVLVMEKSFEIINEDTRRSRTYSSFLLC